MLVEEVDWDQLRASREEESYAYELEDPELTAIVKEVVKALRRYFCVAPKRKQVPEHTSPVELWH
eukprot:1736368-Pyramimonas_sp.AAC.1